MDKQQDGLLILKEEIDQLNRLILQLIDVDTFRSRVQTRVAAIITDEPLEYVDEDGEITIDKQTLIDQAVEQEFEGEYDGPVPTILYEVIQDAFDESIWGGLEDMILEMYNEQVEYNRDPLAYHGLSTRDFL